MTANDTPASTPDGKLPEPALPLDELVNFKHQIRRILHRMNNDLTAVALCFDCGNDETGSQESLGPTSEKLVTLRDLVSKLSRDLREMTHLCRPGSPD